MKKIKIFLILIFLTIAGVGFSQQTNADQKANQPDFKIVQTDQEAQNPSIAPADKAEEAARLASGSSTLGQNGAVKSTADPNTGPVTPATVDPRAPVQTPVVATVKTDENKDEGPSPALVGSGNKQPDTK